MNEQGVWQGLLCNKYLHLKTLTQVSAKSIDSPFSKGLMKVKEDFLSRWTFQMGDGMTIRFWEDTWLGDKPLVNQYPSLYSIVHRFFTVAAVLG
jgi:hypothetical protein